MPKDESRPRAGRGYARAMRSLGLLSLVVASVAFAQRKGAEAPGEREATFARETAVTQKQLADTCGCKVDFTWDLSTFPQDARAYVPTNPGRRLALKDLAEEATKLCDTDENKAGFCGALKRVHLVFSSEQSSLSKGVFTFSIQPGGYNGGPSILEEASGWNARRDRQRVVDLAQKNLDRVEAACGCKAALAVNWSAFPEPYDRIYMVADAFAGAAEQVCGRDGGKAKWCKTVKTFAVDFGPFSKLPTVKGSTVTGFCDRAEHNADHQFQKLFE